MGKALARAAIEEAVEAATRELGSRYLAIKAVQVIAPIIAAATWMETGQGPAGGIVGGTERT